MIFLVANINSAERKKIGYRKLTPDYLLQKTRIPCSKLKFGLFKEGLFAATMKFSSKKESFINSG